MCTAVEWELKNAGRLQALTDALAQKDRYFADEILNEIAPQPEGENVHVLDSLHDTQSDRQVEVIDPVTGQISNLNGPAVVVGDGTRKWYMRGMLHNASGPAIVSGSGKVKYYYLGRKCKTAVELDELVESANRHAQRQNTVRNTAT